MSHSPEELEELDIIDVLESLDSRLFAIDLAVQGLGLDVDRRGALFVVAHDARDAIFDLAEKLRAQDAAKRARGAPRAERVFEKGAAK